ncbi:probable plastid-lipid-associated protein 13, chloroplastic [Rosa rugosa]|uniref:probable plastid-lipid-associated protein 13, chloroplastic n=1 Tax=Rosa rugosa TaxID=74645 RepID=UPI002B413217|nr:probable plastid-lipid-associated protein 13, chloroplastic [Rosa rugosa]
MATLQAHLSAISAIGSSSSSSSSLSSTTTTTSLVSVATWPQSARKFPGDRSRSLQRSVVRAMVQTVPGAPAAYAKEMERLSAKESLLLAFKDAGGFEALVTGKTTDMQRIDVNERITALERVNPTPRPTTSPFLEGRWNFEWFGSGSPGLFAARFLLERFPSTVASLSKMEVLIKEGNAKITANMKILNSIESKFSLSTKLSVEGPVRMKEEYVEGILDTPTVIEETIPEQLKGALGQAVNTVQQLPVPIRDAFANGLRVPLSGAFERLFMISYLDMEIMIIRDAAGVPEILTRLDSPSSPLAETITEYES